jgi:hypothetical protein
MQRTPDFHAEKALPVFVNPIHRLAQQFGNLLGFKCKLFGFRYQSALPTQQQVSHYWVFFLPGAVTYARNLTHFWQSSAVLAGLAEA